jgi:hypothetical protein
MKPGIYPNLPDADYHASEGISNSGLTIIREFSPAHYRARLNEPREETPALTVGKCIHRAVLEPTRFAAEFAVAPKFDMRTNVGKAACAEWIAAHPDVTPVDQDSMDRYLRIRDAVYADPDANRLLSRGHAERSIYTRDPVTGVLVKCRPDFENDSGDPAIVDLKSCADARRDAFAKSAWDYGYYQQAAFYLDVRAWCGLPAAPERFVFIAVEKEPPYAVKLYEASPTMLRRGRDAYRGALDLYAECLANDRWPGYEPGITQIDLPAWAEKRLDAADNDEIEGISYVE